MNYWKTAINSRNFKNLIKLYALYFETFGEQGSRLALLLSWHELFEVWSIVDNAF